MVSVINSVWYRRSSNNATRIKMIISQSIEFENENVGDGEEVAEEGVIEVVSGVKMEEQVSIYL